MNGEPKHKISFAEFEIDAARRRLTRDGKEVRLNAKAFDVLIFLTENAGRVVSKDEILTAVWDGQFVEEANLAVQISTLRKALDEKKDARRFLVTVPGKGYEFVADVRTDEEIVIEKHSFSRLVVEEEEEEKGRKGEGEMRPAKRKLSFSPFLSFSLSKIAVVSALILTTAAAVWFWRGGTENSELRQPKITRLTTSGKVSAVALTPDGRYAVFSQRETDGESLWLRQIETGSQTRIAAPQKICLCVGLSGKSG
jgi:DNA-binding winged helix-turn-helix (wHTH) protein